MVDHVFAVRGGWDTVQLLACFSLAWSPSLSDFFQQNKILEIQQNAVQLLEGISIPWSLQTQYFIENATKCGAASCVFLSSVHSHSVALAQTK